jgi:hypothetical protein
MTKTRLLKILFDVGACSPAMEWVKKTPGTPKELYEKCRSRTWLEFIVERSGASFDWYEYRKAYDGVWQACCVSAPIPRDATQRNAAYIRFNLKVCNLIRKMVPWAKLKKALEEW